MPHKPVKSPKLPNKSAVPAPRTTIPARAGAAEMDAVTIGRASLVRTPKSNVPPGRKGKR